MFYCSDGTYTYTKNYSYRNGSIEVFNYCAANRENMIENARINHYAEDETDAYMNNGAHTSMDSNDDFVIAGAMKSNIYYWAQYPEYCTSSDAAIQEIFYEAIDKKLSAPKGNTLFFMDVANKNALNSPIRDLYDSLFYNAEFIVLEDEPV